MRGDAMSDDLWLTHAAATGDSSQAPLPPQGSIEPPLPPPRLRTMRYVLTALGAVLILGVGFAAGFVVGGDAGGTTAQAGGARSSQTASTAPVQDPVAVETSSETPTVSESAYPRPAAKDFKLTVKTLGKQCFGSAGCNVSYRILVAYSGDELDPSVSYDVVYEVRGGEDGPVTNTLTVTGDTSSVQEEESVSTKNRSAKLTVVVTDVLGQ